MTRLWAGKQNNYGSISSSIKRLATSEKHSHQILGPPNLLFIGYQRLSPQGLSSWGVRVTTHIHLLSRFRMHEAIIPFPHASSQHAQWQFYLHCHAFSWLKTKHSFSGAHLLQICLLNVFISFFIIANLYLR